MLPGVLRQPWYFPRSFAGATSKLARLGPRSRLLLGRRVAACARERARRQLPRVGNTLDNAWSPRRTFPLHRLCLNSGTSRDFHCTIVRCSAGTSPSMELSGFWDSPLISQLLFHPRKAQVEYNGPKVYDGIVDVGEAKLGYRLWKGDNTEKVIVYFHGNGEVVTDYHLVAPTFHQLGADLMVFDFRGYGWSTGTPALSCLQKDAAGVAEKLPRYMSKYGLDDKKLFLFGRSLGAIPAAHLAVQPTVSEQFSGVIFESGAFFLKETSVARQMATMMPGGEQLYAMVPEATNTFEQLAAIKLPMLIIHGTADSIVPYGQAEKAHNQARNSSSKKLVPITGGDHNDLMVTYQQQYFSSIGEFLEGATN
mmetsp:Transcript_3016/g.10881  ORF Transcript_3016/g.10881 Transcript_3016/m.10881 type:complete len:366 (+) Transcript_3016:88-1185(+)